MKAIKLLCCLVLLAVGLFLAIPLKSQNTFQKQIGTEYYGKASSACFNGDSQLIISCGGNLIKTDTNGHIIWAKKHLFPGMSGKSQIVLKQNGGFLILHEMLEFGVGGSDVMIFSTDSAGAIDWIKVYGSTATEKPRGIAELPNADIIVTGYYKSDSIADSNTFVMKIGKTGNLHWLKSYGTQSDADRIEKTIITSSESILLAGCFNFQAGIVKADISGNIIWSNNYTTGCFFDVIENPGNGDIFACGSFIPDDSKQPGNTLILNTDSSGNVKWAKIIGSHTGEKAISFSLNNDYSKIFVSGIASPGLPGSQALLMCLNTADGDIIWAKTYGTNKNESFCNSFLFQNSILNVGYSDNSDSVYHNVYLVKTDISGNSGCNQYDYYPACDSTVAMSASPFTLSVDSLDFSLITKCYPPSWVAFYENTLCSTSGMNDMALNNPLKISNPVNSQTIIDLPAKRYLEYCLFDLQGRVIACESINEQTFKIGINKFKLKNGCYLLNLKNIYGNFEAHKIVFSE